MDIRAYPQPRRAVFAQGQPVLVVLGEVTLIELPFPLFMAASTKPELLVNGIIQLPGHIKHYAVVHLVCYLNEMVLSPQEFPRLVTHGMNVWNMLDINKAAEALGVAEYVDHAYRKCEAYLRRELPEYEELDACTYHAQGDDLNYTRLLRIVAENLAVRMWEDTIPDSEQFHRYLEYNVPLGQQIQLFIQQREAYFAHIEELKEQRMPQPQRANYNHKRREQGDWRPTVANEPTQEDLQWKKEKAQKAAKSKAFWDIKKAQNAEDAKAIQEKLTLSGNKRKFTAREQKYYRELHGTHKLPKGC
ncbi:hypothetical protein CC86DRAFT_395370 [Ophiobolus disseminans]|uniref:Uncharacterized protein n=1 Tax=Ophiobolus disseminans TaxID=1469910 RepID=A0A6A6ZVD0_9PLEO|nr:hypothetical protein CC86DRAFT_395370 [Ophiobolus disseminans]